MDYPHYRGASVSDRAAMRVAAISDWIDTADCNRDRDAEALGWHRVAKVAEEAGEAISEWLLFTGGNPRKEPGRTMAPVIEELLDVAVAALGAVEHLTGNRGVSMDLLFQKIDIVKDRAGLEA
jgi:hypothetical protein